jgi:undecaprenyl-diphosphatase
MEQFNQTLYLALNAPGHPGAITLFLARFFAEVVVWLAPLLLITGWLHGNEEKRLALMQAAASGLLGLLINQGIGLLWHPPRPFMIGLGHTYLNHAPDSSFPSDHLTLIWGFAFALASHRQTRLSGVLLAALGVPSAWARVYLGVHFPFDMAGAAAVASCSAYLLMHTKRRLVHPCYRLVLTAYRICAAPLIRRGWLAD